MHCVRNTHGAHFAAAFETTSLAHIFHKGIDPLIDSSVRFSTTASAGAPDWLIVWRSAGKDIYLMGSALAYCVKYSTPDARHLRFNTHVIIDRCCGIELEPSDIGRALNEMKRAGATLLKSSDL